MRLKHEAMQCNAKYNLQSKKLLFFPSTLTSTYVVNDGVYSFKNRISHVFLEEKANK